MLIPVVLKDGHAGLVSKDELQVMLVNKKIMSFKRSDGWVVVGRDPQRDESKGVTYSVPERRN
jgi:hypothetical protein